MHKKVTKNNQERFYSEGCFFFLLSPWESVTRAVIRGCSRREEKTNDDRIAGQEEGTIDRRARMGV